MYRPALALTIALLAAVPASAASFDCTRAASPDERTICGTMSLNDLDVRMATLYELDLHLVPMGSRDLIRREQSAWLKARRACGAQAGCLTRTYDRRIRALRRVIDDRVIPNGPF